MSATRPAISPRRFLVLVEQRLAIGLLIVLFGILLLQIFGRFVLKSPVVWSEEVARYLFAWIVFIGASDAVRTRSHIAVDLIPTLLPVRGRLALGILSDLLLLSVLVLLVKLGWDGALRAHRVVAITFDLPQSVFYGVVPVGCVLITIRLALRLVDDIRGLVAGRDVREERLAAERMAEMAR